MHASGLVILPRPLVTSASLSKCVPPMGSAIALTHHLAPGRPGIAVAYLENSTRLMQPPKLLSPPLHTLRTNGRLPTTARK